MKVYHATDTRSVRILWLLEELGLDYDLENFKLGDAAMRDSQFLAIHPLGRVPVLEDGEVTLYESGAILQYILEIYGEGRLQPDKGSADFGRYLQWVHFAEGMLMPPVNTIVVETVLLPPERRNDTNVARATKLVSRMLQVIEQALHGRDYLTGEFGGADIMSGHATMVAVRFGADICDKPNISAYIKRLESREALKRARSL